MAGRAAPGGRRAGAVTPGRAASGGAVWGAGLPGTPCGHADAGRRVCRLRPAPGLRPGGGGQQPRVMRPLSVRLWTHAGRLPGRRGSPVGVQGGALRPPLLCLRPDAAIPEGGDSDPRGPSQDQPNRLVTPEDTPAPGAMLAGVPSVTRARGRRGQGGSRPGPLDDGVLVTRGPLPRPVSPPRVQWSEPSLRLGRAPGSAVL